MNEVWFVAYGDANKGLPEADGPHCPGSESLGRQLKHRVEEGWEIVAALPAYAWDAMQQGWEEAIKEEAA